MSLCEHSSPKHVQGRLGCTAPEGRPPSFLVRAFLLSAARRVGRRSGNAIGDGGWAPDCECGARLEGERTLQRSWACGAVGHTHNSVPGLALRWAATALAWQLVVTKAWLHFDGLGLVLVFRLETASGLSAGNSRAASAQSKQLTHLLLLPLSQEM